MTPTTLAAETETDATPSQALEPPSTPTPPPDDKPPGRRRLIWILAGVAVLVAGLQITLSFGAKYAAIQALTKMGVDRPALDTLSIHLLSGKATLTGLTIGHPEHPDLYVDSIQLGINISELMNRHLLVDRLQVQGGVLRVKLSKAQGVQVAGIPQPTSPGQTPQTLTPQPPPTTASSPPTVDRAKEAHSQTGLIPDIRPFGFQIGIGRLTVETTTLHLSLPEYDGQLNIERGTLYNWHPWQEEPNVRGTLQGDLNGQTIKMNAEFDPTANPLRIIGKARLGKWALSTLEAPLAPTFKTLRGVLFANVAYRLELSRKEMRYRQDGDVRLSGLKLGVLGAPSFQLTQKEINFRGMNQLIVPFQGGWPTVRVRGHAKGHETHLAAPETELSLQGGALYAKLDLKLDNASKTTHQLRVRQKGAITLEGASLQSGTITLSSNKSAWDGSLSILVPDDNAKKSWRYTANGTLDSHRLNVDLPKQGAKLYQDRLRWNGQIIWDRSLPSFTPNAKGKATLDAFQVTRSAQKLRLVSSQQVQLQGVQITGINDIQATTCHLKAFSLLQPLAPGAKPQAGKAFFAGDKATVEGVHLRNLNHLSASMVRLGDTQLIARRNQQKGLTALAHLKRLTNPARPQSNTKSVGWLFKAKTEKAKKETEALAKAANPTATPITAPPAIKPEARPVVTARYAIQLAAFRIQREAESLASQQQNKGRVARTMTTGRRARPWHQVQLLYKDRTSAKQALS
ncbi:MAG: SPOR domain-containing protein, partial [Magnetococcales bacterium]|nr:SPOR domain-containing protein [Magnetococcales bacterium]